MAKRREPKWKTEADMCAAFIEWAKLQGWKSYAECCGFDIVLVSHDGIQIGVQAKLQFNMKLLSQILPSSYSPGESGPDYRAILVPSRANICHDVLWFLGLVLFTEGSQTLGGRYVFSPQLHESYRSTWVGWPENRRLKLPAYVPDVVAGASGPVQLTPWKIGALKLCARLEINGKVTRKDFRECGVDYRRWVPMKWVRIEDGFYVANKLPFPDQHPKVYAEILNQTKEMFAEAKS